jgi:hypothetical protein
VNEDWKNQVDIDITDLKVRMGINEANIKDVKEDIRSIKDDTKWVRRAITGAIITAIVGGVFGLFFFLIKSTM